MSKRPGSPGSTRLWEKARIDAWKAVESARPDVEARAHRLTRRVLHAFRRVHLHASDFSPDTGYGYASAGREKLDRVWAMVTGSPAAAVRPQWTSGTAALAAALFASVRPGEELLVLTGPAYDTLGPVLGPGPGSLEEWGVGVRTVPFRYPLPEEEELAMLLTARTAAVFVQRSRGYQRRPALTAADIGALARRVHAVRPQVRVVVDNCYAELTEEEEPTALGADLMAGSWTKGPGGGLAPCGGYVAGKASLVARAADRLVAPGQGGETGAWPLGYRLYFQGLLLAPQAVAQAQLSAIYARALFSSLGFATDPEPGWSPHGPGDLTTRVEMPTREALLAAVRALQAWSPVDSDALPEPSLLPGYPHPVVMAAGTFVQGAGLELTADALVRPPWDLYLQGGLSLAAAIPALEAAARAAWEAAANVATLRAPIASKAQEGAAR